MVSVYSLAGPWRAAAVDPGVGDDRRLYVEPLAVEGWFQAEVPGDVHTDLQREGLIPDPYVADNLEACRWTQAKDWWFYREFELREDLRDAPVLELVLDGLDTIAEVWINDKNVGTRLWPPFKYDITEHLKPGKNTIKIRTGNQTNNNYNQNSESGLFGPVNVTFFPL